MKSETAWLIENNDTPVKYLTVQNGLFDWTEAHMDALRFSRKEDANQVAELIGEDAERIAEHMWHNPEALIPSPDDTKHHKALQQIVSAYHADTAMGGSKAYVMLKIAVAALEGSLDNLPAFLNLNINDSVKVKLTAYGEEVYHRHSYALTGRSHPLPERDADGYTTWQLWDLMQIFGSSLYKGSHYIPFETTIKVENKQVTGRASKEAQIIRTAKSLMDQTTKSLFDHLLKEIH